MATPIIKTKLYPADQDMNRTWFVEYTVNGGPKRKKYGDLNKLPSIPERITEADRLVETIKFSYDTEENKTAPERNDFIHHLDKAFALRSMYLKKKSRQTYRSKLDEFVTWYMVKSDPREIKELGVGMAFTKYLQSKGLSPTTLNSYRDTLKSLCKESKELKDDNPFLEIRKFREFRMSAKYFSKDQQDELKKEIQKRDPQLWHACEMTFYMLLRPGDELRLIKVEDFNLQDQSLRVSSEISKTGRQQIVRIPDEYFPTLKGLLDRFPGQYYVFGSEGLPGMIPHSKKYFPGLHIKILRDLRFNTKYYKFYSWKHTGAAMYYLNTKDVMGLKEQGRWQSLDMVQEYLKNLGVMDLGDVKTKFPAIGNVINL